eukprot:5654463-Amphidinium_carterae.1
MLSNHGLSPRQPASYIAGFEGPLYLRCNSRQADPPTLRACLDALAWAPAVCVQRPVPGRQALEEYYDAAECRIVDLLCQPMPILDQLSMGTWICLLCGRLVTVGILIDLRPGHVIKLPEEPVTVPFCTG